MWLVRYFVFALVIFTLVPAGAKPPVPSPTPLAAGSSPGAVKPPPVTEDSEESEFVSIEEENLPEPFFCEFSFEKKEVGNGSAWVNTGSDYPRIVPPITKRELLSAAFSRSKSDNGPSWGACAEGDETLDPSVLTVILYAHVSKSKSVPDANSSRCRWIAGSDILRASSRFRLRVGEWFGIEFKTIEGVRKRFTVHWPEQTQSDAGGEACRQLAGTMNKAGYSVGTRVKVLTLKNMTLSEEKDPMIDLVEKEDAATKFEKKSKKKK